MQDKTAGPVMTSRVPIKSIHDPKTTIEMTNLGKKDPSSRYMTLKGWSKTSMTIIVIGETGVGKTAFMDLLANVCAGFTLEEFQPTHFGANEAGGALSGSQTQKPVLYNVSCADGRTVNILDTPGLADTRGIEMDNVHKAAIADAIKEKIDVVDAVIILANGTLARLGVATEYALTVISGMFPSSIVNNIGFVFTMVTDPTSFNFERTNLPQQLQNAPLWYMNNPLAQWQKYQAKLRQDPPLDDDLLEEMEDSVNRGYRKTLKTLDGLFKWLDGRKMEPTNQIYALYLMSMDIEASISDVIARMGQTEDRRSELRGLQTQYNTQEQVKKMNQKYEEIMKRPFNEHEITGNIHSTLCNAGGCYSNCHEGCSVGFTGDKSVLGTGCCAFRGHGAKAVCVVCGHLAELHQHYRSKWVVKFKEDRQIDEQAKRRHDEANTETKRIAVLQEDVQKDIFALEAEIHSLEEQLSQLCDQYNDLALSGSFVGYISSAIRLLKIREETMKKDGADVDALKRMEDRIQRLERKKAIVENAEKEKKASRSNGALAKLKGFVFGNI